MSLSLDSRHCGRVFVIKCAGRIVTGEEITILEACINRGLLESTRIVLHVGEVTRVDSTGMGLLVRFLSHTRNRGGDLRLAAPPPFLDNLLRLTKLYYHLPHLRFGRRSHRLVSQRACALSIPLTRKAGPAGPLRGPIARPVRLCKDRCFSIMDTKCCPPADA